MAVEIDKHDNIYYNVRIINDDDTKSINAEFEENRVVPILNNPKDYHLAVVRFSVPAINIPIFNFEDGAYIITLEYQGNDFTAPVQYIQNHPFDSNNREVWNYQEFLNMINATFETQFQALKLAHPGTAPTEAPYLTYDANTQLITLNAEQAYNDPVNGISIYFNARLYLYFTGFQVFDYDYISEPKHFKLLIKDNKNNSATIGGKPYYLMKQEYQTLFLWNDFKSIVFASDSIPVASELLSSQTNILRKIITDFEPLSDINDRQSFQYAPLGPLRYYDLESSYPLRKIDVKIFWEDKFGKLYPIILDKGQVASIKILFKKRTALADEITKKLEITDIAE